MPTAADGERLVCAVLSAQVAQLRDRIDTTASVELMWRTADLVSSLSGLVATLSGRTAPPDAELERQCRQTLAEAEEINGSLDQMAFVEAQRQDFVQQMATCLVTALDRLAASEARGGARISPVELADLYVSEDQRRVHDAVAMRFGVAASDDTKLSAHGQGRLERTQE